MSTMQHFKFQEETAENIQWIFLTVPGRQTLIPLSCSKILLFLISLLKEKFVKFVQGGGLQLLFSYPRVSPSKGGLQYRDTPMLIEEKKKERNGFHLLQILIFIYRRGW